MTDYDDAALPGTMRPLPESPQEMRARLYEERCRTCGAFKRSDCECLGEAMRDE
jgi:hypothetical protein